MPRSLASPHDQKVTFVELFFDLVFVFSVTQVVHLLHDGVTWRSVGEAVLVFWLVWWGWTQFTWALNAADTTHPRVELATLVATAVAFFMAVAVPGAFHGGSLWFALAYVVVRLVGLAIYDWVAWEDPSQRAAVRLFSVVSVAGLASALLGGVLGGTAQYALWGVTILLDVTAAAIGGRNEGWNLHPEHFGERHGLFVIIALGETLIVAASGVTATEWTARSVVVALLAVAVTCALWWSYFTRAKPDLDRALESRRGAAQSTLARDAYSLAHFPMLCGLVLYAEVVQEALGHPAEPLPSGGRVALALGLVLFVGGMAWPMWRATRRLMRARLVLVTATAGVVLLATGVDAPVSLLLVLAGTTALVVSEHFTGFARAAEA